MAFNPKANYQKQEPAPATPKPLGQSIFSQNAAAPSNPYASFSSAHQGVINEAMGQNPNVAQDNYWQSYLADLGSGKLQGQPTYFYGKYAEQKQGEDAIAKKAAIEKQLAAAQFGQQQQGMQAGFAGAGLGKSGFAGQEFENLAAQENIAFGDIYNRMLDSQQQYGQGLRDRWQSESMVRKADRASKKNRTHQIISAGLGAAGMAVNPVFGAATFALNRA